MSVIGKPLQTGMNESSDKYIKFSKCVKHNHLKENVFQKTNIVQTLDNHQPHRLS